jgi:peptidoglycan/LPS O-acetylase OafA/YrhL
MTQKKRIPFDILDSIRGIASLYVVIAHCRGVLWIGGSEFIEMFPRDTWGWWDYVMFGSSLLTRLAVEFVIVFFVLSGFSIAHSLSDNKSPLSFYKRRFIRIYPSYVAALAWAAAIFLITRYWHPEWYDHRSIDVALQYGIEYDKTAFISSDEMNSFFDTKVMIGNLLYMPGGGYITPFWSLTYEVIFYLLAPFLLRKTNAYIVVSALLFLAGFVAGPQLLLLGLPAYIYNFLFVFNIYFALGVGLYKYYDRISSGIAFLSKRFMVVCLVGILVAMYAVNFYFRVETVYSFLVSALLGLMLILYFLKYNVRIPWLMGIGKFSYTLYITHFASVFLYLGLFWLIARPSTPFTLNYFVWMPAVLFCVLIAWVQYLLVEKRTKNILNLLRSKNKQRGERETATAVSRSTV